MSLVQPATLPRDQGLEVAITPQGILKISLGINCLRHALDTCPPCTSEGEIKITDLDEVIKAIVGELQSEEEDGSTPVHRLLDDAFQRAVDNGCEGVEIMEYEEDDQC